MRFIKEILLWWAGMRKRGTMDAPDKRDYIADEVLGVTRIKLPKSVDLRAGIIAKDQGLTNHCTSYAIAHVSEMMNRREHGVVEFDPEELWKEQLKSGATEKKGDYLQNALKSLLRLKGLSFAARRFPATGYAVVDTRSAKDLKKWLARGYPVFTGVVTDMWTTARNTDRLVITKRGGGHAVCIYGYEETDEGTKFWCLNSWGHHWGKGQDGNFYLDEENALKTFSWYIIYDAIDK